MRRALLVGINDYPTAPLQGCVNDASSMANLLEKHHGGSPNFDCKLLTSPRERIIRSTLREQMELLLKDDADVALFYFSGHGTINNLAGFLVTQDATRYDEGVAMNALITLANSSKVREIVMLLDCCHSGALGHLPEVDNASAVLREGVSILTASRASQVSMEVAGEGVFTSLLRAGLSGGASDVVGKVTIASLYAYVDQALPPPLRICPRCVDRRSHSVVLPPVFSACVPTRTMRGPFPVSERVSPAFAKEVNATRGPVHAPATIPESSRAADSFFELVQD